ncbi:MAG: hypothetical protein IPJ78_12370 [Gemmatimonadetes bacterium]|nr:hypothetical protein [Gemmatimonadota bacterium]
MDYLRQNSSTFREWYDKVDADRSVTLTIRDATEQEMEFGVQNHFDATTSTIIFNPRNLNQGNYDLQKNGETRFFFTAASVMGHEMSHAAGHFGVIDRSCGGAHPASSRCSLRYENLIRGQLPSSARGGIRLFYDEANGTRTRSP